MVNQNILDLSKTVRENLGDAHKRAVAALRVFIIGSYKDEDKKYLVHLRDALQSKGIGAFLMEEIEPAITNYKQKFDAIWNSIRKAPSQPLFLLFAGLTAGSSQGFVAELVEIAVDPQKLDVALFI